MRDAVRHSRLPAGQAPRLHRVGKRICNGSMWSRTLGALRLRSVPSYNAPPCKGALRSALPPYERGASFFPAEQSSIDLQRSVLEATMLVVPALRETFLRFFPTAHEPGARLYHDLAEEARDDQETPRTDVLIQCVNGPLPLEEILPWLVNLRRGIYKFESCAAKDLVLDPGNGKVTCVQPFK